MLAPSGDQTGLMFFAPSKLGSGVIRPDATSISASR